MEKLSKIISNDSLTLLQSITDNMEQHTFHHHYHILYDIRNSINRETVYVEIGAYAGGSASLMASHKLRTSIISIDIGWPMDEDIVKRNVNKFKSDASDFNYIKGSSAERSSVEKLNSLLNGRLIDILFIDGDHSYGAVISDFKMYSDLVAPGGYIIFDDYMDFQHSPDVKPAVDYLVESELGDAYIVFGCDENKFAARPSELTTLNCFVIQKKYNAE